MFRFRPSVEFLETRENPSDPGLIDPSGALIDPTTGLPTTTTTTTTTDPTVTVDPSLIISH